MIHIHYFIALVETVKARARSSRRSDARLVFERFQVSGCVAPRAAGQPVALVISAPYVS
jgi:hypothetical protein